MADIFNAELRTYEATLRNFVQVHELPSEWFAVPDHLAFKGADTPGFEKLLEEFRPRASQLSCIEMDGRRLATAHLSGPLTVGSFGTVEWIEIMEPRPAKVGKDIVGLEHMEFYYPNFDEVTDILKDRDIAYDMQSNPGHSWVNIVLNNKGQELKLNDKLLGDTVREELESGESYVI